MSKPVDVTTDHEQRAYAQMRKHDTPPLDVLRQHWLFFSCVRLRAAGIARGETLPPEPVATAPPAPPPRAAAPPPARRREDRFDPRAAASGEYIHPDEA